MSTRRLPDGYTITPAAPEDVADLVFADLAASRLFAGTGYLPDEALTDHVPIETLEAAMAPGHLTAVRCRGDAVGFAMTSVRGNSLYLDQISVDPAHGRKGLGAALMEHVIRDAGRRGLKSVTLSTFRDLAWNGPFYRSLGFRELARKHMEDWMLELEASQAANGLDVSKRCFMVRRTGWL
jgi:4-diphosphocytidyl-2-C-methyl-D-erythritol kinase